MFSILRVVKTNQATDLSLILTSLKSKGLGWNQKKSKTFQAWTFLHSVVLVQTIKLL